jgi:hypothetical protein
MNPLKYWKPQTFEIASHQFKFKEMINKTYDTIATDQSGLCKYSYNELGFRGDSIKKDGFKVMSIGCSNTIGVGVNDDETWSSQFCKLITNGVDMNFGMPGRSSDYVSRCLLTFFDSIKPNLVLIMYPNPVRREFYTKNNHIVPFMPTNSWGYLKETEDGVSIQKNLIEIQNDNEDFVNWYKNHLLVTYFLKQKNCNWIWNGYNGITKEYHEFNRFDGDFGNPRYIDYGADGKHPGPKHNKIYAQNLFQYINFKFPEYLEVVDNTRRKFI